MAITKLPDVGRIQGLSFHPGPDPRLSHFELQYKTDTGKLFELHIPALDALFLLNMLEAASRDHGLEPLRRPPGSG